MLVPSSCGCGTPSVWAIVSVIFCSGSGNAPAALSPQLAIVAVMQPNTNAVRRRRLATRRSRALDPRRA